MSLIDAKKAFAARSKPGSQHEHAEEVSGPGTPATDLIARRNRWGPSYVETIMARARDEDEVSPIRPGVDSEERVRRRRRNRRIQEKPDDDDDPTAA